MMGTLGNRPLIAQLRALFLLLDPPPARVYEAAAAALDLRDLDAELADLLADTAAEDLLVGARGAGEDPGVRLLSFEGGEVGIELQVSVGPDGTREVLGQLVGADSARVVLRQAADRRVAAVDAVGRFRADGLTPGPLRCELDEPCGRTVTGWVVI
jgi:hypothetical protein